MNKFNNEIENAIKIINNAISEAARNNINPVVVEVPCVGRKFCKPIKEYFEAQGWKVERTGVVDWVDDYGIMRREKVASVFLLTW